MKVLFLTTAYPTPESPVAGIFVKEHARAAAAHAEIAILHLDRDRTMRGRLRTTRVDDEFPTWRVRYPYRPTPLSVAAHLAAAAAGWRHVRRAGFDPDAIHAHFFLAGVPAVLLGRMHRKPVLVTEQWSVFLPTDPMQLSGALRRAAAFAYGRADRVLPASEALRRGIEAEGIHARFAVVPNVVDTRVFRPDDAERNGRLLAVGLLYEAKGYEYLLEALARLAADGRTLFLDIVGDGPRRAEYEDLARRLGIADQVVFHGLLPKDEVARMMRRAQLFVLASRYDNNPCVLIESLASGLPVVATAVGGIPELVDASSGRLARPRDPESIAREIAAGLDGMGGFDRPAIAAAARERYSLERVGALLGELYADAVLGNS